MAPASPSAIRDVLIHIRLLFSVSLFGHKNTQGARSFRGEFVVAFTSCNAFIRQLTHGLGGGVAPNSLHRVAQSFARVQKAARGSLAERPFVRARMSSERDEEGGRSPPKPCVDWRIIITGLEHEQKFPSAPARSFRVLMSEEGNRKEQLMWIKTSLIALGFGAMAAATPARPWLRVCTSGLAVLG